MNPAIKIPAWRVLTNWLIAVSTGSIIVPLLGSYDDRQAEPKIFFLAVMVAAVLSAVCSLPALIVLLVAHVRLNRKDITLQYHRRIHGVIHLLAGLFTFLVLFVLTVATDDKPLRPALFAIPITYMATGFTAAFVTYSIYIQRSLKPID